MFQNTLWYQVAGVVMMAAVWYVVAGFFIAVVLKLYDGRMKPEGESIELKWVLKWPLAVALEALLFCVDRGAMSKTKEGKKRWWGVAALISNAIVFVMKSKVSS